MSGKQYAFFDSCTHHPSPENTELVQAEKMAPVRRGLKAIFEQIERLDAPILSVSCLGILRTSPQMCLPAAVAAMQQDKARPRVAYISLDAAPEDLEYALTCRRIIFERRNFRTGDDVVKYKTYDVFGGNPHASEIVRRLGKRHWIAFGAGFDHCLVAAVEGLCRLGMEVSVIQDGCINGGRSTPASTLESARRMKEAGARWETLDEALGLIAPA